LTSIIEKRLSLHKHLASEQQENEALKSQISRLQALANIGTATCMIAHELNNLLTPAANYAALARKNPQDKALVEKALEKTVRSSQNASMIMESILALANGESQQRKKVQIKRLVEEIFQCLARDFSKDGITVNLQIPKQLTVWVVPVQLQQVLMNLIFNAREAMLETGGTLTISAEDNSNAIRIEVRDTGRGISSDEMGKIFQPFFSTKAQTDSSSRKFNSGLGLAFCKKIIDDHDGSIVVESEPAMGSTFKITLPKRRSGNS